LSGPRPGLIKLLPEIVALLGVETEDVGPVLNGLRW
jgi:hypothetical protein